METKIKPHPDEVTDFYEKEIAAMASNYTFLAVISLDSALKKDKKYYLQVFLKVWKNIKKKVIRNINDNLTDFSSSNYSEDSDEEQFFL